MHHDLAQLRQRRLELLPDPDRQALAGGVFQSLDFVEVMVVQAVVDRLESGLDVAEIHDPAGLGAGFAADMQLDAKRMAVQARAFMPRGTLGSRCAASRVKTLKISMRGIVSAPGRMEPTARATLQYFSHFQAMATACTR